MKEEIKINIGWHRLHMLSHTATIDQAIEWHLQHSQHCQCKIEMPVGLQEEMKKRGFAVSNTVMAAPVFDTLTM
jgi:hypothetical protein